jgi:hypothetical protein
MRYRGGYRARSVQRFSAERGGYHAPAAGPSQGEPAAALVEAGYRAGRYHVATNRACTRLGGPVASPLEPGLICAWAVLSHLQPERADHTRSVAQPPRGIPMTREGSGVRRPYAGKSAS